MEDECVQMQKAEQSPVGILGALEARKAMLEEELTRICAALDALEENPDVASALVPLGAWTWFLRP